MTDTFHQDHDEHEHGHGSHGHHKPKKVKPSNVTLNVTSMVDILFNLLVYFIVTATVVLGEGALKAALPGSGAPVANDIDTPPGPPKFIELQPSGPYAVAIAFDGSACADFEDLHGRMAAKAANKSIDPKKDVIIIRPNYAVRWQHVVNAFNQAVRAGYEKVSFGPPSGGR